VAILLAVFFLVFSHTVQIWGYASYFIHHGVFEGRNEAVYFCPATYTFLRYSDVVIDPEFRIFGAFASVTGLLAFGIGFAFLVAVMAHMLRSVVPALDQNQEAQHAAHKTDHKAS